jgi:hypothetical protein
MMAISRLNNENKIMISFFIFNKGGLDKSSPYISTGGLGESSPCIKKKIGLMNQVSTELTIISGGIN